MAKINIKSLVSWQVEVKYNSNIPVQLSNTPGNIGIIQNIKPANNKIDAEMMSNISEISIDDNINM